MSADLFRQLAEDEARRLSEPVRSWITTAYLEWMAGANLERACGLINGHGSRRPATQERFRRRDALLRRAWCLVPGDSNHEKAITLARIIRRLDPVYRRFENGHRPALELHGLLCQARAYENLPQTPRRILSICAPARVETSDGFS